MKKRFIKENSNSDRFYLTVNLDERGDYSATLYDYDDNEVWDCDYELVSELIDDGYLKYKPDEDLDRLAKYLGSVGVIPRGSTIDPEKEESMEESRRMYSRKSGRTKLLESKLKKIIKPIVERMLREEDEELPEGWTKQKEWHGNRSLGYDSYMKKFAGPGGRKIPVYVFGKDGNWGHFTVSAGANSDYSYTGMIPNSNSYMDVINGVEQKARAGKLII